MEAGMQYAAIYLLLLNLMALIMIRSDKHRAIHRKWRIPERRFMFLAIIGGGIGIYAGCRLFRHKINHPRFMIGVPVILAAQVIAAGCILFFFHVRLS
jgi:uncharacterized membrane protein YsdA (DUF1294 family)